MHTQYGHSACISHIMQLITPLRFLPGVLAKTPSNWYFRARRSWSVALLWICEFWRGNRMVQSLIVTYGCSFLRLVLNPPQCKALLLMVSLMLHCEISLSFQLLFSYFLTENPSFEMMFCSESPQSTLLSPKSTSFTQWECHTECCQCQLPSFF